MPPTFQREDFKRNRLTELGPHLAGFSEEKSSKVSRGSRGNYLNIKKGRENQDSAGKKPQE